MPTVLNYKEINRTSSISIVNIIVHKYVLRRWINLTYKYMSMTSINKLLNTLGTFIFFLNTIRKVYHYVFKF